MPESLIYDTENVGHLAFRVYAVLLRHRNDKTGLCVPSRKRLAKLLGVSTSSVDTAINGLVKAGWLIKVARSRPDGGQTSNEFAFPPDPLPADWEGGTSELGGVLPATREPYNDSKENDSSSALTGIRASAAEATERGGRSADFTEPSGDGAQALVAFFVTESMRFLGVDVPGHVKDQIGSHVKALLKEGYSPESIKRGLREVVSLAKHPSTLPHAVWQADGFEALAGPHVPANDEEEWPK